MSRLFSPRSALQSRSLFVENFPCNKDSINCRSRCMVSTLVSIFIWQLPRAIAKKKRKTFIRTCSSCKGAVITVLKHACLTHKEIPFSYVYRKTHLQDWLILKFVVLTLTFLCFSPSFPSQNRLFWASLTVIVSREHEENTLPKSTFKMYIIS